MKKPEILSPGGSIESIHAAINAGCDAVYVGGRKYGARAFADNLCDEALVSVIDDVHFYDKKIYITVNTVFNQNDFKDFYRYMKLIYEAGCDAVIVQDFGVMDFIHREFPDMPIHASTQMNIMQAAEANLLKPYGVTRIVTARELSFMELSEMRKNTDVEIELFVQGALCFSCSGQCLMSSLIGGRSGNKGACAQPCRKLYRNDKGESAYFLSLKDLCSLHYIPELICLSVDSFKIEGRMKKPEYVALATYLYRKYTDMYCAMGEKAYRDKVICSDELRRDIDLLKDIYNRGGFTCGYLTKDTDRDKMLAKDRPGHLGFLVGKVIHNMPDKKKAQLRFVSECHPGDILEIRDRDCNVLHQHTLKEGMGMGESLVINTGYNCKKTYNNCDVVRVRNEYLINSLHERYGLGLHLSGISGKFSAKRGRNAVLSVHLTRDYHREVVVYGDVVEKAVKRPTSKKDIYDKVMVSADTLFAWDELEVDIDDDIFMPVGMLKTMRREALTKLYLCITKPYHRSMKDECVYIPDCTHKKSGSAKKTFIAEVRTKAQYDIVNRSDIIDEIYVHVEDMTQSECLSLIEYAEKPIYLVMPRIFNMDGEKYFSDNYDIRMLLQCESLKGFVVCTLSELSYLKHYRKDFEFEIRSADNLYVRNSYAQRAALSLGITKCSASVEMTEPEIVNMMFDADIAVYNRPRAMVTIIDYGDTGKLYDSYGNAYFVNRYDNYGYTEILHYETIDLTDTKIPSHASALRVVFTNEQKVRVMDVLERIKRRLV